MRDDFDAQIADRFAVLVEVAVPDTWSRVQSKLLDRTAPPFTDEEPTMLDLGEEREARPERHWRRLVISAAALVGVAAAIVGLVVVTSGGDTLAPADSVPASEPPFSIPSPTSVPVDAVPATAPAPTTAASSLWVELQPGEITSLPPAPIPARNGSAVVWTDAEVIIWGGFDDSGESHEGAAFNPTSGTWRLIAPPPDGVRTGVVLWTGTEMLVWPEGGSPDGASAAYDPANDSWRLIVNPPVPGSVALWTGDEAVLLRDPDVDDDGSVDAPGAPSFAYDPTTDEWRRLADGPWGHGVGWVVAPETSAVWTGTTIITMTDSDDGILLNGYDPRTDTWRVLEGLDTVKQPVVIPGRASAPSTLAFLPLEPDTPLEVFDDRGNAIGEWAGRPAELALTCIKPPSNDSCLLTSLRAVAVGGEILFWHSADGWAFDPETQKWRTLPLDGRQPGYDGTEVVAAGDLLFAWGADRDGLVYRAAVT